MSMLLWPHIPWSIICPWYEIAWLPWLQSTEVLLQGVFSLTRCKSQQHPPPGWRRHRMECHCPWLIQKSHTIGEVSYITWNMISSHWGSCCGDDRHYNGVKVDLERSPWLTWRNLLTFTNEGEISRFQNTKRTM